MNNLIDEIKKYDNAFIDILKALYSIGKSDIVAPIIESLLGIVASVLLGFRIFLGGIILLVLLVLFLIFKSICSKYATKNYVQRKYASKSLKSVSSSIKSLSIEVESNKHWKSTFFNKSSQIVCEKIMSVFNEVFKCKTRISVEYVFNKKIGKKDDIKKYVKMSGRKSPNREVARAAMPLEKRKLYFSYDIFNENMKGLNILREDELKDSNIWFTNSEHSNKIKMYIGIGVSVMNNEKVDFIIQIDFLSIPDILKDKSDEEIKQFVNRYLTSYINILCLSYLISLNKNKEIPGV